MKLVPGEGEVVADPCACSATQQTSCCPSTLRERGFERREVVYKGGLRPMFSIQQVF